MSGILEIIVDCRQLERACEASFSKNGSELHMDIAEAAHKLADLLELHVQFLPEIYTKKKVEIG